MDTDGQILANKKGNDKRHYHPLEDIFVFGGLPQKKLAVSSKTKAESGRLEGAHDFWLEFSPYVKYYSVFIENDDPIARYSACMLG
jgi:hypothetical protein